MRPCFRAPAVIALTLIVSSICLAGTPYQLLVVMQDVRRHPSPACCLLACCLAASQQHLTELCCGVCRRSLQNEAKGPLYVDDGEDLYTIENGTYSSVFLCERPPFVAQSTLLCYFASKLVTTPL